MIDFDKFVIHARHDDPEILNKYGEDSGLSLGMEIVSNTEEMCLILDIVEMTKIYSNLTGGAEIFLDEEEAAEALWIAMEERPNDIPEVDNGKLTKVEPKFHLDEEEDDDWDDIPEHVVEMVKAEKPKKKKGVRTKELMDKTFCLGQKTPRKGTTFAIFTSFIDDNMEPPTFDELVEEFIDKYEPSKSNAVVDEKFAGGYVRGAFNEGYIEEEL